MTDTWTIQAALEWTQGYLERKGDENSRVSAQWLLSEATGLARIELYTHFEQPLSMAERDVLRDYVTRRGLSEPLQYITGEVGFRHISVRVRPGVLIPRPETEVLVSEGIAMLPPLIRRVAADALDEPASADAQSEVLPKSNVLADNESKIVDALHSKEQQASDAGKKAALLEAGKSGSSLDQDFVNPGKSDKPSILVADLCTGSGCVACSVAHEYPHAHVIATDIAPEAVALARENVEALGLSDRVEVIECDLGSGIPVEYMGLFDLIISNPPYVPTAVLSVISQEVTDYEPALALDGGADGLDVFHPLVAFALRALKPGGTLALELHETCLDESARLAKAAGFASTRIVNDLTGRPRVLVAVISE